MILYESAVFTRLRQEGKLQNMNQDQAIRLIQRYSEHRLLWDQKHPNHLNSRMRKECWMKITNEIKLPVNVLKKKMVTLLSSHRQEVYRERKSRLRGTKYAYNSKWFGYPYFDFIRNKNKQVKTSKSTDDSQPSPETNENMNETYPTELQESHTITLVEKPPQYKLPSPRQPSRKKRRRNPEANQEQPEYEEFNSHNQSHINLQNASNVTNDPYISFGNHIASELRKYDQRTLACVKHAINNIIFDADMGNIQVNILDHLAHRQSQSSSSVVTDTIVKFSPASSDSSC